MTPINTISPTVKYGLYYAASWPDASYLILRKFLWAIFLSVVPFRQYSYLITHFRSDTLIEIIDNVSICLPVTLVIIKLIVAWTHHSQLRKILTTMEEECKKYAVIDTNNLISKTAHLSYSLTTAMVCTYIITTIFYAIGVLMPHGINGTSQALLLKMDLPFDYSKSLIYDLVIIVQYFYQVSGAYVFGVFTALLLMIVLHIGCQIDIMCQTLSKACYKSEKQIKFFINRHQEIITFAEGIEQFFTYIALGQFVSNTLLTCCLGYLMVVTLSTTGGSRMFIKCILFYIATGLEALTYSYAGEYLNIKSKLIGDTAYKFLWYNSHPSESRLLIPVILRSQRGFTFTCGKFTNLSLENFTSMMKASASYVSVLLAMS